MKIISTRKVKQGKVNKTDIINHVVILTNQFKLPRKLKKKLYGTKKDRKFLVFENPYEVSSFSYKMRKYRKYNHKPCPTRFKYDVLGTAYNPKEK